MYYIGVRDGKKEKWKKKAKINHRILVFFLTIYLAPLKVYKKFEDSGCILWRKVLLERKKNGQMKGMISSSMLILFYTTLQVKPKICTKFQNLRRSSSWEIFDTNFPMYYIGVRDGKKEKDGKN